MKKLPEDAPHVFATCPTLSSLQLHTLLHHIAHADSEQSVNTAFAEQLVRCAQLEEAGLGTEGAGLEINANPEFPFKIPQTRYFIDSLRGVPPGLHDFLQPLIGAGEHACTHSRVHTLTVSKAYNLSLKWSILILKHAFSSSNIDLSDGVCECVRVGGWVGVCVCM